MILTLDLSSKFFNKDYKKGDVLEMTKKLGFGFMRLPLTNPDDQTSIDYEQLNKMVDTFLERGFTYFDTAYMYHNFISEKVLNEIPNDFIKEYGTFYPNCTIKIREAPSQKGNDTGLYYTNGMSVQYDGYVKRDGYVWISWICASGKRRWMAGGELNSKGINVVPYGVFK